MKTKFTAKIYILKIDEETSIVTVDCFATNMLEAAHLMDNYCKEIRDYGNNEIVVVAEIKRFPSGIDSVTGVDRGAGWIHTDDIERINRENRDGNGDRDGYGLSSGSYSEGAEVVDDQAGDYV